MYLNLSARRAASTEREAVAFAGAGRAFAGRWALRSVSMDVRAGELLAITGPSGAGKTTLLRLVHGQLQPSHGVVRVLGRPVDRWRLTRLRREVAFVHQENRLLPRLAALENIVYALRVTNLGAAPADLAGRARQALSDVGLQDRELAFPDQLSAGQRQRLAIARAVAARPRILLADEATANLDARNADLVVACLTRLAEAGTTVIFATHDVDSAESAGGRIAELRHGRLVRVSPGIDATCYSA